MSAKAKAARQAMLATIESRSIKLLDAPKKMNDKVLRKEIKKSSEYQNKITEEKSAKFLIIDKPESCPNIAKTVIERQNLWFVIIGNDVQLTGRVAESMFITQKGTAKGKAALNLPQEIMKRVVYIEDARKSYSEVSLYKDIKESKDYVKVSNPDNAIFYVISNPEDCPNIQSKIMNQKNIWFVVFDRQVRLQGSVADNNCIIIKDAKLIQ